MSELATLARPYAVAAYKRAKETGSSNEWSEALAFVAQLMQDPKIAQAATNPKAKKDDFSRAFLDLCGERLAPEVQNFIRLLIANRRLSLIGAVSEQFEQQKATEEGYIEVTVTTAYRLDDASIDQLKATLQRTFGKDPRLTIYIDDRLIGGVLIKAGDRVIDASVAGQLQRLAKRLYN